MNKTIQHSVHVMTIAIELFWLQKFEWLLKL